MKESEKIPNLVKISLEKGKIKENEWEDKNKLNKLIYDCINLENTIKNINEVYDKINNYNSNKELEIEFIPMDEEIEQKLEEIKKFGGLVVNQENISIMINNSQPNIAIDWNNQINNNFQNNQNINMQFEQNNNQIKID